MCAGLYGHHVQPALLEVVLVIQTGKHLIKVLPKKDRSPW